MEIYLSFILRQRILLHEYFNICSETHFCSTFHCKKMEEKYFSPDEPRAKCCLFWREFAQRWQNVQRMREELPNMAPSTEPFPLVVASTFEQTVPSSFEQRFWGCQLLKRGSEDAFRFPNTRSGSGWTSNPKFQIPNPKPQTPNPKPQTLNPKPQTPHPKLRTQNPKTQNTKHKPQTKNQKPQNSNLRPKA